MPKRPHDLYLFVANAIRAQIGRRFHRDQTEELKQMILHHVAQCAGAFVVTGAAFHSERFRRCDLKVVDVTRVPERFEDRIRESKHENVLRGLFSEKVIDPVDLILGKCVQHNLV